MKHPPIKISLILMSMIFYSCTKVIDVKLDSAAAQIVIEGNITNATGPYQVLISRIIDFSASNTFPPVTGAIVKITDNTSGQMDSLEETAAGIYETKTIKGVAGHTYQLSVSVDRQAYAASSTMPQLVPLDSVTFERSNIFGNININAVANFKDPAGIENYYSLTQFVNSRKLKNTYVLDDRLSDGKYIIRQIFSDSTYINPGDTVTLQMNCIDKSVWNYFNSLGEATGNNFQSVSPANPLSNISNNALGYFSASAFKSKKRVVNR